MKKAILLLLYLFPLIACAQKLPNYGIDKIRIADQNGLIQAEILPVASEPSKKVNLTYYWYSANRIHQTQGSYSGNLLNGTYNEYFPGRSLKTQGQFKEGLKDGIWRSWSDKGVLTELYTWKRGVRDGSFMLFNEDGKVSEKGKYKNDAWVAPDSISLWKKIKHVIKKKL